ncbi:hypothetical protein [Stenotrophomonas maltophilia]|uniref:Uncharacterized protein n=1 Tax=Stenotrophomonas maltophilia TaxID=40324 RepID=A0AAJ2MTE0_STEMA|nr:hypothetical protein [Stenotrophomonas maltophilia]MDT3468943.1 hypothetical protein [Stenotrophomonas maltophilia]
MKITEEAINAATEVLMRGPEPGSDQVPVRSMLEAALPFIDCDADISESGVSHE